MSAMDAPISPPPGGFPSGLADDRHHCLSLNLLSNWMRVARRPCPTLAPGIAKDKKCLTPADVKNLSVDFHTAVARSTPCAMSAWSDRGGETLAILAKAVQAVGIGQCRDEPARYSAPPPSGFRQDPSMTARTCLKVSYEDHRALNGKKIAMIFQTRSAISIPLYGGLADHRDDDRPWRPADKARERGARTRRARRPARTGKGDAQIPASIFPAASVSAYDRHGTALKPDILIADSRPRRLT